jgi:hypothetical protein
MMQNENPVMGPAPKHTPGPWFVQSRKRNRICGPEGVIVAEAWYPPSRTRRESKIAAWEQGNVNAQLIATAPDLLDAIRGLAAGVDSLVGFDDDIRAVTGSATWRALMQQLSDAYAVIAKAEGRFIEPCESEGNR